MKALAIHGKEDLRWEDRELPVPGPGQLRLRVRYVGICGSDLHYYFHGANGANVVREPLTPGHELSAVVDLDPSGTLAAGTPVTVHPARYGAPVTGLAERPHLFPGGDYLGSAAGMPHRQGGAAEYLIVDSAMVRVLPDRLPLDRAALAEPLAVALHAVRLAGEVTGRRVLVNGAGAIGLLVVAVLADAGAGTIGATDVRDEPLTRAGRLGASELTRLGRDDLAPESFDIVFECSGVPAGLTSAVRATRPAGTVIQVGMLPDAEVGINLAALPAKELTIRGAFRFSTEIDDAVALLAESATLGEVVSHVLPASDAVAAFALARDSSASAKVLLEL
ncbi:L-idonate 5-dehydrogenase [Enemella evansiae]|uniref:L-idonate 5-dehydrogenase n=1 Tax=Enemella evansiae TaxID=2016499 RepID=A0A255GFL0_9ACTN|nr:L-idonate 5-dehydrogenase [Enemella evansiae]OYN92987.1 L-idonate 5-dehydrogenase [Enemella evansiae]OYO14615.1 L-idonate 5-dehydrogenase [Enemella evansiae]